MKKTILVTGSTDGVGKLLSLRLAEEGYDLLVHGRNREKLAALVSELEAKGSSSVKAFVADFSDMESVAAMAQELNASVEKIDVLINNAGIYVSPVATNKDGIDVRFTVNYLAVYKLTNAILPLIRKGNEPRIINLSSAAQADVAMDALKGERSVSVGEAYAQSKLALTMWNTRFAQEEKGIVSIAVNPGSLLNTKMANEAYGQSWSPAEKGVDILHELAFSLEHKDCSGKYFDNDKGAYAMAHSAAYDDAAISELIETTKQII